MTKLLCVYETRVTSAPFQRQFRFEPMVAGTRQSRMRQMTPEAIDRVAKIVAEAAKLPLYDAAYSLWCQKYRLDELEGRMPPSPEEVAINRAMTSEQSLAKYRSERDHAHEGPMFALVKRAQPRASDDDIKLAIIDAVKFYDDCEKYFKWDGDFWDCVVRAVAQAQCHHPHYLDATYRDARNHLAYMMK
jgi:hypothetical protein